MPTPGTKKDAILEAIQGLTSGGGTNGAGGIKKAYELARASFVGGGTNRVVLCTDGDFNVGPSSDAEMERLVERRRAEGTYLTVLGFGTGNLQDAPLPDGAERKVLAGDATAEIPQLLAAVRELAEGRLLLAGAAAESTRAVIRRARAAADAAAMAARTCEGAVPP